MRLVCVVLCFVIVSVVCQKSKRLKPTCGGTLSEPHGVIQSPGFPARYPVPIRCQWVIDASNVPSNNASIVVYLTQLFVVKGLTFTEYAFYDSSSQYGERLIHTVTAQNVTKVRWIQPTTMFLVIDFHMKELEGNQLRALDGLLDVFGFNITYEISTRTEPVVSDSCSVADCSFVGNCFIAKDYSTFWCQCFEGFSGPSCGHGPLCEEGHSLCQNGATCRHAGANAVICNCPRGFNGTNCGIQTSIANGVDDCGETECLLQCPFDGRAENVCNCPQGQRISTDKARFEGVVQLANAATNKNATLGREQLQLFVERQLTKYMKNFNLSKIDDLRILKISSAEEVTFHFFGAKKDGNKVREALNRLVQRGRLGNLTFVPTHLSFHQEPILFLQSVQVNRPRVIREGEEFIISCVAQGSSYMTFQWYKDGIFVNTTKAIRSIWTHLQPLDSSDQYTATLGVSKASFLDEGVYTCQVEDWGIQQCKSVPIEVRRPPVIEVYPKSVTAQKGDNVSIICISTNDKSPEVFGYNWTKNKLLFKSEAGAEVWEELYPAGSILKINNVQKSAVYSCKVTGYVTTSADVRVDVLNKTTVPLCAEDTTMGINWPETSPGVYCIRQCPPKFIGDARRLCTLRNINEPDWDLPDFSACFSETLVTIHNNFRKLTYGYQNTTGAETMVSYLRYLNNHSRLLPGEGERMLDMVDEVITYMNTTQANDEIYNATGALYQIVDALLKQEHSIMDTMKVIQLQRLVTNQALLSVSLSNALREVHVNLNTINLDIVRLDSSKLHSIHIPLKQSSYPEWFADKLDVRIERAQDESYGNQSFTLAVIAYKNLSSFLPVRSLVQMRNGNDLEYEVISRIVSVSLGRDRGGIFIPPKGTFWLDMELKHNSSWESWNVTCGVTDFAGTSWDLEACSMVTFNRTFTKCTCTRTGVFALLHTTKSSHTAKLIIRDQLVVQIGCVCCLVQSLIAMGVLIVYWWYHQSSLAYLKIQCSGATIGAMAVFLYAICNELSVESYPYITTFLDLFLLVGMSSHLSKILIVYTELVQMSRVKRLKPTVVGIITGVPVIAVFGNHVAHRSMDRQLDSWWLQCGTLSFNIFVTSSLVMVILFLFLYFNVMHKLNLLVTGEMVNSKCLNKRIKLLRRSALLFLSMVCMVSASIVYINVQDVIWNYIFSTSCIALGFLQLICYVIKSENSLYSYISNKSKLHKTEEDFSSESPNSPFRFFTQQDPEAESECVPSRQQRSANIQFDCSKDNLLSEHAKLQCDATKDAPSTNETYLQSDSSERYEMQTNGNDDAVDLELYNSSPKKYQRSPINAALYSESEKMYPEHWLLPITTTGYVTHPPDILTAQVCVELDLVAMENVSDLKTAKTNPTIGNGPEIIESIHHKQLEEEEEEDVASLKDKNLDGMLDRISIDLDYLLNRNTIPEVKIIPEFQITPATPNHGRKSSKIHFSSIREQIEEEDENIDAESNEELELINTPE